ncbi:putative nuclease HARBI1 [Pomacea canaliculata]|uniref:putative nuclease HARBI1 n=1 Tax=Pomacea canaliculata TaxID=400727 RepID=UPI000D72E134|nr:putative nuclease HARBI1 [Pomacea canaliculata]
MAALMVFQLRQRRLLRRNRVFRDRTHPFEVFDDMELYRKFCFRRAHILALTDEVADDIAVTNRQGALTPLLQVLVTLRYFASSSFQDVCGELIGVNQSTVSRTVSRVADAWFRRASSETALPSQVRADVTKRHVHERYGFPNVIGFIDGTLIRIQAPTEQEHEFVSRKGYHAINVQMICDADLIFINCIAKWPGSVHDSRILRESEIFETFENSARRPLNGIVLGDSGYMQRDWLFTPHPNPVTQKERNYNYCHSSARATVERAIGVSKRRWHCLRRLRLHPVKACKVITACVILHNRARLFRLDVPCDSESESDSDSSGNETD